MVLPGDKWKHPQTTLEQMPKENATRRHRVTSNDRKTSEGRASKDNNLLRCSYSFHTVSAFRASCSCFLVVARCATWSRPDPNDTCISMSRSLCRKPPLPDSCARTAHPRPVTISHSHCLVCDSLSTPGGTATEIEILGWDWQLRLIRKQYESIPHPPQAQIFLSTSYTVDSACCCSCSTPTSSISCSSVGQGQE